VERRAQNFLPAPDGNYLLTGEGRTHQSIAKFSEHDALRIDDFNRELETIADVLRAFVLRAPRTWSKALACRRSAKPSTP
jgi:hypothetical protein